MLAHQQLLFSGDELDFDTQSTLPPPADEGPKFQIDANFGLHLLALGQIKGIGVHVLRAFRDHYGTLQRVWDEDQSTLQEVLQKARAREVDRLAYIITTRRESLLAAASRQLDELSQNNIVIIEDKAPAFPQRLASIPGAPYWLFVQGNITALHEPLIGIVGTRDPSTAGIQTTAQLAGIVASEGLGIVSGLAEGIDHVAHRVGILYGIPQVAVLGTGIDIFFPEGTRKTRLKLLEHGGAVISEYLPGDTYYNKGRFVERNRIQAALAIALGPVESKIPSGTLHTVNFAEKYHRPVFGVYRHEPPPENLLLEHLRLRGHPTFDLSRPESMLELVEWLKRQVGLGDWPTHRRLLDRDRLFQAVLQPLSDIASFVMLDADDLRWLHDQIDRRVSKASHSRSDGENGS